jgi:hypothetical protein
MRLAFLSLKGTWFMGGPILSYYVQHKNNTEVKMYVLGQHIMDLTAGMLSSL